MIKSAGALSSALIQDWRDPDTPVRIAVGNGILVGIERVTWVAGRCVLVPTRVDKKENINE